MAPRLSKIINSIKPVISVSACCLLIVLESDACDDV